MFIENQKGKKLNIIERKNKGSYDIFENGIKKLWIIWKSKKWFFWVKQWSFKVIYKKTKTDIFNIF